MSKNVYSYTVEYEKNWNWTILFLTWNMRDNEADEAPSHSFSLCQGLQRAANWEPEGVRNDLVWEEEEKKVEFCAFLLLQPPAFKMSQVIEINVLSEMNHYS